MFTMCSNAVKRPEWDAIVKLPTLSSPSRIQTVVGKQSALSPDIQEFRGIPYGCVPARWEHSSLRTCLPQDVFDATRNGPKSPQPAGPNNSTIFQSHLEFPRDPESEFDCLNLFIVRPSQTALAGLGGGDPTLKLPVLVWIHGGGYGFGAATDPMWDPTRLVLRSMQIGRPIIAVAMNYRLNIFGFIASTDIMQAQSGLKGCNFGLHDQKVAIIWVSRNIASFGGDPQKITLAGQSAGGNSVHTHTLEAECGRPKPLFRRSIIQSGAIGCLGPISLKRADSQWDGFCRLWQIEESDAFEKIELLRRVPAADLLEAASGLSWLTYPLVIDDETVQNTKFGIGIGVALGKVDEGPQVDEIESQRHTIDVLLGDIQEEFHVGNIDSFEEARAIFENEYPSSRASNEILETYRLAPGVPPPILRDRLTRFLTDVLFSYPAHCARSAFSSSRQERGIPRPSVQSYRVKFGNPFSGRNKGVAHHCVELIYLFDSFHDDLRRADKLDESSSQADGIRGQGSETPGFVYQTDVETSTEMFNGSAENMMQKTNAELVHEIQDRWIRFIFDDDFRTCSESTVSTDQISVYGKDRALRIENLAHDAEWVEERKRFKLLEKHIDPMRAVGRELVGLLFKAAI